MAAEKDEPDMAVHVTDVAELPVSALRAALEFAVNIAAAGQKTRPPLMFPAGLKPFLKFQRLDQTSLRQVRRTVAADDDFRERIGLVAATGLVDELGIAWLQRSEDWEQRVLDLHAAAKHEAQAAAEETALRKSERRREAAEETATRAQAELLAARDDVVREQARREKAEARALVETKAADTVRGETGQLKRELDKLRARLVTETERADAAAASHAASAQQIRNLEAIRDAVLMQRATTSPVPPPEIVRSPSTNPEAVQALEQAASATHELSQALGRAARALSQDGVPQANETKTPEPGAAKQRAIKRKPIAIPGGVYGDTSAAAIHLLRTPSVCVIIDGYNVAKLAWPQLDLVHQRESCISLVEDLARRFGTDLRLVFDGADVVGSSAGRRLIRVQYSPTGVSADDVIRAEVAALPTQTPVVVVTNDQAIAVDVRNMGANVLASNTLLAAAGRGARS